MRFWEKSLRIFQCLCDHGRQGVRHIAQQTGLSKSRVHRLTQAMERRSAYPESWLWETAEGREWLTRLVVATLYTFGLKRGVGMETLSEFFARVHLETQVGCSPSALRGVMQALERALLTTAGAWEQDGLAEGETREIIGAVDETFLEHMMWVFMDLKTGYLLLEVVAEERTYARWKACVDERLTALSTGVRYLVSDRAKALIQLAEVGLECMSMPDCFHVMHDLVQSDAFAIARRIHQAQQALKKAEEVCSKQLGPPGQPQAPSAAQPQMEGGRRDVERWQGVHSAYRHHLAALSLALHPFDIDHSSPQNSVQGHRRLEAEVAALDTLAHAHQLPARDATMHKVRKQLPALAALVDFWWAGVEQDVEQAALSAPWRQWAREGLLPWVYWEHPVAHTRCPQRKAKRRRVREAAQAALHTHALTRPLPQQALTDWHTWARQQGHAFQRASSAVEGRNGALAQLHHHQRGLPPQRYKVWTILHNFDCYAPDGTTPAARFFGRAFPDLFATVLSHIEALPQPRRRKCQIALNH